MRSLLTTLLMAAILVNLVIGAVAADAHQPSSQQIIKDYSQQTYVPSFLR